MNTKLKAAYERNQRAVHRAKLKVKDSLLALIEACPHDNVLEGDYREGYLGTSQPPFRVCTTCGLAEEGWGCGYTLLPNAPARSVVETRRETARKGVNVFLENGTAFDISRGRKKLSEVLK